MDDQQALDLTRLHGAFSRRSLLTGFSAFAALSGLDVILPPRAASAAPVSTALASSSALPLADPVEPTGRLLHGVWLPDGPASAAGASSTAYSDYTDGTNGVGRRPAIVNYFRSWSTDIALYNGTATTSAQNPSLISRLDAVHSLGAIPMLTWEPWDPAPDPSTVPDKTSQTAYNLVSMTGSTGSYNGMITAVAKALANWGKPVIIRMAHEMNTTTYPWCPGKSLNAKDGSDYAPFWIHVRSLFDAQGADNVMWAWVPNIEYPGSGPALSTSIQYPGHDKVDWVGLDGYNGYHCYYSQWITYTQIFDASISALLTRTESSKPIMIAENGCVDATVDYYFTTTSGGVSSKTLYKAEDTSPGRKRAWFTDFFAYASDDSRLTGMNPQKRSSSDTTKRNLRAVCYFNENKAGNWALKQPTMTTAGTASTESLSYRDNMQTTTVGHGWDDAGAPATALLSSLTDSFADSASSTLKWDGTNFRVTYKTSSGASYASLPCDIDFPILTTSTLYRLMSNSAYFQIRNLPAGNSYFRLYVPVTSGTVQNEIDITFSSNGSFITMQCQYVLNGAAPVVVSGPTPTQVTAANGGAPLADFAWWRVREAAGFLYWETCANAAIARPNWQTRGKVYNLLRSARFRVQFKTGTGAIASGKATSSLDIANFNVGRVTTR